MSVRAEGQGRAPARMHAASTPMVHSDVTVNRDLLHANLTCVYALGLNTSAAHTLSLMYIHEYDIPPLVHVIKSSITAVMNIYPQIQQSISCFSSSCPVNHFLVLEINHH